MQICMGIKFRFITFLVSKALFGIREGIAASTISPKNSMITTARKKNGELKKSDAAINFSFVADNVATLMKTAITGIASIIKRGFRFDILFTYLGFKLHTYNWGLF